MVQRKILSFGETFEYKGLIDAKDLYKILNKWLTDRGYEKFEKLNSEHVYPDGKQIFLEILPNKQVSDDAKGVIHIQIKMNRLKEKVVKISGIRKNIYEGEVEFTFNTYLETDKEGAWSATAHAFFFRTLIDRFIYRTYIDKLEEQLVNDKDELMREIKSYLNMERFEEL